MGDGIDVRVGKRNDWRDTGVRCIQKRLRVGTIGLADQQIAGAIILVFAHVVLGSARTPLNFGVGIGLWGLHMGLTQSVLSSLLADVTPAHLRGSAFGVASLISGVVMLAGNTLSGVLWHWRGAEFVFAAAAVVSCLATVALVVWRPGSPSH